MDFVLQIVDLKAKVEQLETAAKAPDPNVARYRDAWRDGASLLATKAGETLRLNDKLGGMERSIRERDRVILEQEALISAQQSKINDQRSKISDQWLALLKKDAIIKQLRVPSPPSRCQKSAVHRVWHLPWSFGAEVRREQVFTLRTPFDEPSRLMISDPEERAMVMALLDEGMNFTFPNVSQ